VTPRSHPGSTHEAPRRPGTSWSQNAIVRRCFSSKSDATDRLCVDRSKVPCVYAGACLQKDVFEVVCVCEAFVHGTLGHDNEDFLFFG